MYRITILLIIFILAGVCAYKIYLLTDSGESKYFLP